MISKFGKVKGLLAALLTLLPAVASALVTEYPYVPAAYNDGSWERPATSSLQWQTYGGYCAYISSSKATGIWLIGPEMQFTAGNKYTVSFRVYTEKTNVKYMYEKVNAYLKLGNTAASETVYAYPETICTSPEQASVEVSFTYEPASDQCVHFALEHVATASESWECRFSGFNVTEEIGRTMPKPATDFTATAAEDGQKLVNLAWTNPAEYNTGDALTIAKLLLGRDGEQIAEIDTPVALAPGASVTYTDTPEAGFHTYELTVVDPDGLTSATATAKTGYVGPYEGVTPTYAFNFSSDPLLSFWDFTAPEDANAWVVDNAGDNIQVSVNNVYVVDAHAVTPGIALKSNKAYRVTFNAKTTISSNAINLALELKGPDGEQTTLAEFAPVKPAANNKAEAFTSGLFTPAADGMYTIDLHATAERMSSSMYSNTLTVSDITIEEVPVLPEVATNLAATVDSDAMTVTLTWTTPSASASGVPLSDLTADITRDGELIASVPTQGGEDTYADAAAPAGYHIYTVTISNAAGAADEAPATVTAPYLGAPMQLPFAADFSHPALWLAAETGANANGNTFTVADGKASVTETEKNFADLLLSAPIALSEGDFINWSVDASWSYNYSSKTYTVAIAPEGNTDPDTWTVLSASATSGKGGASATAAGTARVPETGTYTLVVYVPGASYDSTAYTFAVTAVSVTRKNVTYHMPPFVADFATEEGRDQMFIVDDSTTPDRTFEWTEDNTLLVFDSTSSYPTSTSNRLNDWIITPPITFYTGYTYTITFEARVTLPASPSTYYLPYYLVYLGQEPSAAAMGAGLKLSDNGAVLDSGEFKEYSVEFTPDDFSAFTGVMTAASRAEGEQQACVLHAGVLFGNKFTCYPQVEVRSMAVTPDREIVTGVEDVAAPQGGIAVMGNTVTAPGLIEAFTPAGALAGRGDGAITLAPGLYIVRAAGAVVKIKI